MRDGSEGAEPVEMLIDACGGMELDLSPDSGGMLRQRRWASSHGDATKDLVVKLDTRDSAPQVVTHTGSVNLESAAEDTAQTCQSQCFPCASDLSAIDSALCREFS